MNQTHQFERERAKRLCAAMTSSRMGTSYQTEYKRIGDGEIHSFWYQAAEVLDQAMTDRVDALISEAMKPERVH